MIKFRLFFFKTVLLKSGLLINIGVFGFVVVYIGEEALTKHVKFSKFKF